MKPFCRLCNKPWPKPDQASAFNRPLRINPGAPLWAYRFTQGYALLVAQLSWPDLAVRTQTLAALHQCGYRANAATLPRLEAELQAERSLMRFGL